MQPILGRMLTSVSNLLKMHLPMDIRIMSVVLTFLFVNIRSLQTHKLVFEQLLREEHVTAFALNETFLTPRQSIRIPKYALIRSDCPQHIVRAHGGTAIGHYSTIPTRSHTLPPQLQLPEHTIDTVYTKERAITFYTIYIRPGHAIPYEFF